MTKTIKRKNRQKSKRTRYRKRGGNPQASTIIMKFPTVKEHVLSVFKNSTEFQNMLKEKTGFSFDIIEKHCKEVNNAVFVESARKTAAELLKYTNPSKLLKDTNRVQTGGDAPYWVRLCKFMACFSTMVGMGYNPNNHPCHDM